MRRGVSKKALTLALIIVAITTLAFKAPTEKYFEIAKSLDIFVTLFKEVNAYYVDEVEPEKLVREGIDAMLESLDPYTDYISEDEIESFRISTTGQYGGVGAMISQIKNKTLVSHPYKNYPAYNAGLRVGDEILSVDGKSVQGKSTSEVSKLLKGQPRTEVQVRVKRPGAKEDVTVKIKRQKIRVKNIAYAGLIEKSIGYIKLDDFTPGASREVADAVLLLKQEGATSLILDLRENPGGLLIEAVNTVNLFIPKGEEVVSTRGKMAEWNKTYTTLNQPIDLEIPLVVLTSEESASASEIVAGALQDYDRAILVGGKTFGKGLVQTTRPLSYNGQLKVTTAKYYIPSGRCIQELDYTHRKSDGTVVKVADSLKSSFKTKCGRIVYDGGGLDPDFPVKAEYMGALSAALLNEGLIFLYATKYAAEHAAPTDFTSFRLTDKEYNKFVEWTKTQEFTYRTPVEKQTEELEASLKQMSYFKEVEHPVKALKEKIASNKAMEFVQFKSEIMFLLEKQIAFNYALYEGQIKAAAKRDTDIIKAQSILKDSALYSMALSVKHSH